MHLNVLLDFALGWEMLYAYRSRKYYRFLDHIILCGECLACLD